MGGYGGRVSEKAVLRFGEIWMSFSPPLGSPVPCAHTSIKEEFPMAHIPEHRGKWTGLFITADGHLGILVVPTPTKNTPKELRGHQYPNLTLSHS